MSRKTAAKPLFFRHFYKTGCEIFAASLSGRGQENPAKWQEKVDFYHEMEADQYRELEEYGYLKSYGGRAPSEE